MQFLYDPYYVWIPFLWALFIDAASTEQKTAYDLEYGFVMPCTMLSQKPFLYLNYFHSVF